jgi:alkylated DNA repair dioxygenase AlkB
MQTLFPIEPLFPDGFSYSDDFISTEEEADLLGSIKGFKLDPFLFQGYEAKRRVASFGFDWNFDKRVLTKGKPIPEAFLPLIEKTAVHLSIPVQSIGELLLTEYPAGAVINWHRDAPPFETIIGISLLSDCVFKLRPHEKAEQARKRTITLPVRRRSLYIMSGPSRSDWQHSILPVKSTRYSITIRTLK